MGVKVQHGKFPTHHRHDDELKSWNWCLGNSILIGPFPGWKDDWGKWFIEIKINGKRSVDPAEYTYENVMHKVYEYCDYYYNKYKKDEE